MSWLMCTQATNDAFASAIGAISQPLEPSLYSVGQSPSYYLTTLQSHTQVFLHGTVPIVEENCDRTQTRIVITLQTVTAIKSQTGTYNCFLKEAIHYWCEIRIVVV